MIACSKWAVIQTLDYITETFTKTVNPNAKILKALVTWVPKDTVLERERSDAAHYCLIPADMQGYVYDRSAKQTSRMSLVG